MLARTLIASIAEHPKKWALATATATHLAGAGALLAAELGAPVVVVVPLFGWLLTIGLPTTLAVLLTASAWGVVPGLWGWWFFLIAATLASWGLEALFFVRLARFLPRVVFRREGA